MNHRDDVADLDENAGWTVRLAGRLGFAFGYHVTAPIELMMESWRESLRDRTERASFYFRLPTEGEEDRAMLIAAGATQMLLDRYADWRSLAPRSWVSRARWVVATVRRQVGRAEHPARDAQFASVAFWIGWLPILSGRMLTPRLLQIHTLPLRLLLFTWRARRAWGQSARVGMELERRYVSERETVSAPPLEDVLPADRWVQFPRTN